jgi:hypothetical protein
MMPTEQADGPRWSQSRTMSQKGEIII